MHPDLISRIKTALTSREGHEGLLSVLSALEQQDIAGARLTVRVSVPKRPQVFIPQPLGTLFGTIDLEAVERADP